MVGREGSSRVGVEEEFDKVVGSHNFRHEEAKFGTVIEYA
jgi:hypothetical protein